MLGSVYEVAGATGNVGGALARILVAEGIEVRALVRGGKQPPEGAQPFEADLGDGATWRSALEGADGAFLLAGYDDAGIVAELQRAGVKRVALLSGSSAPSGDESNVVAAYHIASERALAGSGIPSTFLRPNTFMTNTLRWADAIRAGEPVSAPFADIPVALNDVEDVAAVAAVALTAEDHEPGVYRITGPEALTPGERVAILGEVLGRDLRFEPQSDEDARAEEPRAYSEAFYALFRGGQADETTVLPTVREVTGREPRSFRAWAEANAAAFR
jgi:uncharacterized protein YbjT (DUF2867 family)